MANGRTQMASIPRGPLPKGPAATGLVEDAKFYALNYAVPANSRVTYDLQATAFYVDDGPAVLGDMEFSVDDCFPEVGFRYGLFWRMREFRRIHLINLTGGLLQGRLIYSMNPDFMVIQSQV